MADVPLVNRPVYELRLSENEAKLIKLLTQNCLHSTPRDEPPIEKECRESIFNALTKAGVK